MKLLQLLIEYWKKKRPQCCHLRRLPLEYEKNTPIKHSAEKIIYTNCPVPTNNSSGNCVILAPLNLAEKTSITMVMLTI